jgi:hypothetical protein
MPHKTIHQMKRPVIFAAQVLLKTGDFSHICEYNLYAGGSPIL